MARWARVDDNDNILGVSDRQQTRLQPDQRSIPYIETPQPVFDPLTENLVPTYTVTPTEVTESWSTTLLTPAEQDARKQKFVDRLKDDRVLLATATALFNHENRIRVLEAKPTITKQQFITGLKALL